MSKITKEIKQLIENNALALSTISTASGNPSPHCIAVGYAKLISYEGEESILITDNFMLETSRNIKKNPNVAIAVWSRNWEKDCKGYEIRGRAEYFMSGPMLDKVKKMPENKGMVAKAAIVVRVDKIKKLA